ncbi:polysaccharide deacetylase family protein [Nocardioides halotolerans]|jgi:peptidoglycan/xylan/chitin deacetylase (PgdA/CDA1 family)|uniref:polysaccharide deacetylase family protein n=1 Tax=Nocardioides halotolerans TaxID=433660 RepID=UPI00041C9B3D|nr:polysaccharide deacetylase family protein [Nocardioides halotolerans]
MTRADGGRWVCNVNVHGVGVPTRPLEEGEDEVWVSVEQLEGLLDAAVGRPEVVITFDDGNISDLEIGLPMLLERGLTARFYPCAGLMGEPGRLDESDIRELHAAGMVIGSHGWRHRDWRTLGRDPVGAPAAEELVRARQTLERVIGAEVTEVAVPFGSYDRHVVSALRRTGASRVYTSDGGWARPGAWLQARTSIRADHGGDFPSRVMSHRPGPRRRLRGRAAQLAKRLRG